MQYRMLYTTDVHIHGKELVGLLSVHKCFFVLAVHVAKEVPGRSRPLRHGVGLSLRGLTALRACGVDPGVDGCKR